MSKKVASKEVSEVLPEKIMLSIKGALATSDGFYKGAIIKAGQKFDYEGLSRRDGSLPLWFEAPEGYKLPKKAVVKINKEVEEESEVDSLV